MVKIGKCDQCNQCGLIQFSIKSKVMLCKECYKKAIDSAERDDADIHTPDGVLLRRHKKSWEE
tara:strand:+ start:400 stop:588 length:189 start_codon:yes stop_codon:yes gene_type:complete